MFTQTRLTILLTFILNQSLCFGIHKSIKGDKNIYDCKCLYIHKAKHRKGQGEIIVK